jgi:hypothetical protein
VPLVPKQLEKPAEPKPAPVTARWTSDAEPAQPRVGTSEIGRIEVKHPASRQVVRQTAADQPAKLGKPRNSTGPRDIATSGTNPKKLEASAAGKTSIGSFGSRSFASRRQPERSPTRPALPSNVSVKAAQEATPKPKPAAQPKGDAKSSPSKPNADEQRDSADLWVVSMASDDDRELTTSQLRDTIAKGLVARDTIVWREGMTDWLPIFKVPELAIYLKPENVAASPIVNRVAPTPAADDGDEQTVIYKPSSIIASPTAAAKPSSPTTATTQGTSKWASAIAPKTEPSVARLAAHESAADAVLFDTAHERPMRATARSAPSLSETMQAAEDNSGTASKPDMAQRPAATVIKAAAPGTKAGGGPPPLRRAQPSRPDEAAAQPTQSTAGNRATAGDGVVTSVPTFHMAQPGASPPPLPVKAKPDSPASKPSVFPPPVQAVQPFMNMAAAHSPGLRPTSSFAPRPSDIAALTKIRPKFPKWLPFAVLGGLVTIVAVMAALSWRSGDSADTRERTAPPDSSRLPLDAARSTAAIAQTAAQKGNTSGSGDLSSGFANKFAQAAAKQRPTARFDREAAEKALAPGFLKAAGCHNKGEPTGNASVTVSIAPSGQVLSVTVAPPFTTTFTAECIRGALREIQVPPFQGSPGRLAHSIIIH